MIGIPAVSVPQTTLEVADGRTFPVRRIYCIGRNYAEHAREMGSDPKTEPPFFFQKPNDAAWTIAAETIGVLPYPPLTQDLHHEVELVVCLAGGGRDVPVSDALGLVFGYAIGLDMTRRDRQARMKETRRPWEIGKSFDRSAPVGPIVAADTMASPPSGRIELSVNGDIRQRGDLGDMIWSIAEQIAELSKGSELRPGDLIFTGTPAGVGPIARGDDLLARIAGLPDLRVRIS